jgi:DNA polymerase-4
MLQEHCLELLADLSAVVQVLPPTAALVEAKGALRYHGVDGRGLAEMARLRAVAHLGVDLRIGIASTAALAATASAQAPLPGGLVVVEPEHVQEWLEPLPVGALYGIGERQVSDLRHYGVHRVGQLAGLSLHTVQRILGARAGRLAWERARGIDPRPVTPPAPCPPPSPAGTGSPGRRWTEPRSAQPSSTPSSAWAPSCAAVARSRRRSP